MLTVFISFIMFDASEARSNVQVTLEAFLNKRPSQKLTLRLPLCSLIINQKVSILEKRKLRLKKLQARSQ